MGHSRTASGSGSGGPGRRRHPRRPSRGPVPGLPLGGCEGVVGMGPPGDRRRNAGLLTVRGGGVHPRAPRRTLELYRPPVTFPAPSSACADRAESWETVPRCRAGMCLPGTRLQGKAGYRDRARTCRLRRVALSLPPLVEPAAELTVDEVRRYSRHLIIPDVGMTGQKRLKNAKVLCVGAGGLGSPALLYLAAAGVGTLGIIDFDVVDESNLQRQIIHGQHDVGRQKSESARDSINELNPLVNVVVHDVHLDTDNVMEIFAGYDLIVDGTDNFATRYMVNDACVLLGKPYVWGSIYRFDGQASVFWAEYGPCYRCLYPEPPPPG